MTKSFLFATFLWTSLILTNFGNSNISAVSSKSDSNKFHDYWNRGGAEITSYELKQARYGEIHKGSAVLVFVTEPFSKKKHVKLDNYTAAGKDKVNILKLNFTKKFLTGIYPYSMMMSSFVPIDFKKYPDPLKITTSSQEWCGHTFTQINLDKNQYNIMLRSYFETEGDNSLTLGKHLLEDEIWTRIRLNPATLPQGDIQIIPGTMYQRLKHVPFKLARAGTEIKSISGKNFKKIFGKNYGKDLISVYKVRYKENKRELNIYYKSNFPHSILAWQDTYGSGWGVDAKILTTKATKKKSIRSKYWTKNSNSDRDLRKKLELSENQLNF